jgi:hypothetical protein
MQSATRFGRSENGGVLFKARTVPCQLAATGQRFMFETAMLGRSACRPSMIRRDRHRLLRRSRLNRKRVCGHSAKPGAFACDDKKKLPSVKWFCQYPDPRLLNSGFLLDFSPDGARHDSSGQKMFKKFKFCSRQGRLFFAKPRVALHKPYLNQEKHERWIPRFNCQEYVA